jgi:predicted hydrocarbon binding protein
MATTLPPQPESAAVPPRAAVPFAAPLEGLRVSADFLTALHQSLEHETGDAAERILSETGRRWGAADMQAFIASAPQVLGAAHEAVHIGVLLQTWWWPRTAGGWGAASFDFRRAAQRLLVVELRNSAEARASRERERRDGQAPRPVCHLYAGYFAGGLSALAKRDLTCVELQCHAAGADTCQFLLSTAAHVQQARQWREAGESAAAVVRKLTEPHEAAR